MRNRVVITGMGIVSPLGHSVPDMWDGLMTGQSGAAATTLFDASTFPTTFGAEVKNFDLSQFVKHDIHNRGNRGTQFAVAACAQACRQSGIDIETDTPSDGIDRTRMGIYLGAGEGAVNSDAFFNAIVAGWDDEHSNMDWNAWTRSFRVKTSAVAELQQEPNMPVSHLGILTGARGISRSCLTACAASTQAVGEAAMLVRRGKADMMISGGAHSMIHPLGVTGFNRLTALSTRNDSPATASRPALPPRHTQAPHAAHEPPTQPDTPN